MRFLLAHQAVCTPILDSRLLKSPRWVRYEALSSDYDGGVICLLSEIEFIGSCLTLSQGWPKEEYATCIYGLSISS